MLIQYSKVSVRVVECEKNRLPRIEATPEFRELHQSARRLSK